MPWPAACGSRASTICGSICGRWAANRLESQFPTILRRCRELGLAPSEAPIPVAPAAHYWMGGVGTDLEAATSLPGLYAVGEVACTGVHGANRLASNSLMECLVFARQLRDITPLPLPPPPAPEPCRRLEAAPAALRDAEARIKALRRLCWEVAGVERRGVICGPPWPACTRTAALDGIPCCERPMGSSLATSLNCRCLPEAPWAAGPASAAGAGRTVDGSGRVSQREPGGPFPHRCPRQAALLAPPYRSEARGTRPHHWPGHDHDPPPGWKPLAQRAAPAT